MNQSSRFLESFPLPEGWTLKWDVKKGYVLHTAEGLSFFIDFPVKKKVFVSKQPLIKALGFKNRSLSVLDITAGWSKDAFLTAQLGCQVTAVESHPFVFHFVKSSLESKAYPPLPLKLILGDSLNYLKSLKKPADYPDVIFMDPMFEGRKKSLSQKSMRILKALTGTTQNKEMLFQWALEKAQKRVVVKRHKLDKPLSLNFISSFKGHSVCYDVFSSKGKGVVNSLFL